MQMKSLLFCFQLFFSPLLITVSASFSRVAPLVCHACIKLYDCIAVGASLILNFQLMEALMKFILRWLSKGSYSVTFCELVHFKGICAQTVGYSLSHPCVERERYKGKKREDIWMRQLMCSNAMLYLCLLARWLIRQCGRHAPTCIWWFVLTLSITCCDTSQVVIPRVAYRS